MLYRLLAQGLRRLHGLRCQHLTKPAFYACGIAGTITTVDVGDDTTIIYQKRGREAVLPPSLGGLPIAVKCELGTFREWLFLKMLDDSLGWLTDVDHNQRYAVTKTTEYFIECGGRLEARSTPGCKKIDNPDVTGPRSNVDPWTERGTLMSWV